MCTIRNSQRCRASVMSRPRRERAAQRSCRRSRAADLLVDVVWNRLVVDQTLDGAADRLPAEDVELVGAGAEAGAPKQVLDLPIEQAGVISQRNPAALDVAATTAGSSDSAATVAPTPGARRRAARAAERPSKLSIAARVRWHSRESAGSAPARSPPLDDARDPPAIGKQRPLDQDRFAQLLSHFVVAGRRVSSRQAGQRSRASCAGRRGRRDRPTPSRSRCPRP